MEPEKTNETNAQFDRGTPLTLFDSDRQEDWVAIIIAFIIAAGIVLLIRI